MSHTPNPNDTTLHRMCIGELLALQLHHTDFKANQIRIKQALSLSPEVNRNGNVGRYTIFVAEPKTVSSYRTIPLPLAVREELLKWQNNLGQRFRLERTSDTFVFCNTNTGNALEQIYTQIQQGTYQHWAIHHT